MLFNHFRRAQLQLISSSLMKHFANGHFSATVRHLRRLATLFLFRQLRALLLRSTTLDEHRDQYDGAQHTAQQSVDEVRLLGVHGVRIVAGQSDVEHRLPDELVARGADLDNIVILRICIVQLITYNGDGGTKIFSTLEFL